MEFEFKITKLTHDDLVNFFSTALYGNNAYYTDWDEKFDSFKKSGKGECFEDHIANILLNGGEIMISDLKADDEDEWYNGANHKTSVETIHMDTWQGERTYRVPTYHINLNDIYKAFGNEEACDYVRELFVEENGDVWTADSLMQILLFGEIVYG